MISRFYFFFFNDTATTEIYTLSLHDALPISSAGCRSSTRARRSRRPTSGGRTHDHHSRQRAHRDRRDRRARRRLRRSEEHTSELQSRQYLVCRLLLEKKKTQERESYYNNTET